MAIQYKCISADDHVNVHPTVYIERVPAKFKDRAPRVEFTPQGDYWVFEGKRTPAIGLGHQAGRRWEDYKTAGQGGRFEECRPGSWDPKERIKDMAIDGVDAEVLYSGHFGGQATDAELRLALLQAYHDWKADFCRYAPDRFKATASLPMWDINLAIQEMERLDKTGVYAQTAISSYSPDPDKPYRLPYWDPMWSAFEEHNWLATIHVGGATRTTLDTDPLSFISCTPICAEPFAMLIFGGVLERHPKLRLISAETGFGWWPYFNDRMDTVYRRHRWWTKSTLPNLPSFYVKRQVWYTFEEDRAGMELLHHFGEDRVMWAADYPHTDTTWPDSQKFLDEHFRLVPEKDRERRRRLITCENAGRLYGWIK